MIGRALGVLRDLLDDRLQTHTVLVPLGGHLLALGQQRLDPAQVDQRVAVVRLLDDARDDLAQATRVLLEEQILLGLADALVDDLLRRLGGDAPEVVGSDLLALGDGVVDHGLLVLEVGLLPRGEDQLEDVDLARLLIDLDLRERDGVRGLVVRRMQRVLQGRR